MACGHKTAHVNQRENRLAMREGSEGKRCWTSVATPEVRTQRRARRRVRRHRRRQFRRRAHRRGTKRRTQRRQDKVRFVRADAFDFAAKLGGAPPCTRPRPRPSKFAPSKPSLKRRFRVHRIKQTRRRSSVPAVFSSRVRVGAVTQERLLPDVVAAAAAAAGTRTTLLASRGAGPPSIPYAFSEYLTVLTVRVR